MNIDQLLDKIKTTPSTVEFNEVIEVIDKAYNYTPVRFHNGVGSDAVTNDAGTNEGSCKIFSFGSLNKLDEQQTLNCFGEYYRDDVLKHPENNDHANIRNFISHGWDGIRFEGQALRVKD